MSNISLNLLVPTNSMSIVLEQNHFIFNKPTFILALALNAYVHIENIVCNASEYVGDRGSKCT